MAQNPTLHGSWVCGIYEMGEYLARKGLHPDATHTFPLSETKRVYEAFDAGKVVISWEDA